MGWWFKFLDKQKANHNLMIGKCRINDIHLRTILQEVQKPTVIAIFDAVLKEVQRRGGANICMCNIYSQKSLVVSVLETTMRSLVRKEEDIV